MFCIRSSGFKGFSGLTGRSFLSAAIEIFPLHGELFEALVYLPFRLYGAWLVGLRLMFFSDALVLIAAGVRPNFKPITRVGVLPFARLRSSEISLGFQGLPEFRLYFAIVSPLA